MNTSQIDLAKVFEQGLNGKEAKTSWRMFKIF